MTTEPEHLPGLEPPPRPTSPLERAVTLTLEQLTADGHLDSTRDAARIALAHELAAIIAGKRASGRASTVGADAKVLLELLDGMVPAEAATSTDVALAKAMAEWADRMTAHHGGGK